MDSLESTKAEKAPELYWTAVANVVEYRPYGPGGREIRHGTKHFRPGAKIYIIDWFPGTCDAVIVVGHHRKSNQLIKLVVRVDVLEGFRPKLCYSPAIGHLITEHFAAEGGPHRLTREFSEQLCEVLPTWRSPRPHA